jgi:glycolate oxidase FAD binding subunit
MIGSFGTLGAIASVNFKLIPLPLEHRTFVIETATAAEAIAARDRVVKSVLQPAAVDIVKESAYRLVVEVGGNAATMERYERELGVSGIHDYDWTSIREYTPRYLASNAQGCVARVACKLTEIGDVLASTPHPALARAANGVVYTYFPDRAAAEDWASAAEKRNWRFVFEYGIQRDSAVFASDFPMMKKVKALFDPKNILNPGRMYGRI